MKCHPFSARDAVDRQVRRLQPVDCRTSWRRIRLGQVVISRDQCRSTAARTHEQETRVVLLKKRNDEGPLPIRRSAFNTYRSSSGRFLRSRSRFAASVRFDGHHVNRIDQCPIVGRPVRRGCGQFAGGVLGRQANENPPRSHQGLLRMADNDAAAVRHAQPKRFKWPDAQKLGDLVSLHWGSSPLRHAKFMVIRNSALVRHLLRRLRRSSTASTGFMSLSTRRRR